MAIEERKIALVTEVNAEPAKDGFSQVKTAAADMAQSVAQSGQQASKSVSGIGDGVDQAAQKVDRGAKSIISQIQRTTAVAEAGERGTRSYFESLAKQRGINSDILRPYLEQLDAAKAKQAALTTSINGTTAALNGTTLSAKQLQFALRGVPAQFTDIFTSLAAGQNPLTVLLQQGGQLKDMFGGVGVAARALTSYIVGLVTPFRLAALAVGVLGAAYVKGQQEAVEYQKAIILSGNAAGTTAGQLGDMAKAISASVGTQGKAADALAQLAGSGKVANENLKQFAETAIRLERSVGTPIKETVKVFEELAKAPLEASVKLNDSMNYLTASTYKQIKALEEQGRTTDAAALAQRTYADETTKRAKDIENSLGTLEKGWLAIVGAAKKAWDSMLNVGRERTLSDQLAEASANLERTRQQLAGAGTFATTGGGAAVGGASAVRRASLQNTAEDQAVGLTGLLRKTEIQERNAMAVAETAKNTKLLIEFEKQGDQFKSRNARRDEEIARAKVEGQQLINAGLLTEAGLRQRIADINEKFKKQGGSGAAGIGENEVAAIKARIQIQREINRELDEIIAAGGNSDIPKKTQAEKDLARIQEQLATTINGVARAQKQLALEEQKELVVLEKGTQTRQKTIKAQQDQAKGLKELSAEMDRQVDAIRRSAQSTEDQAIAQERANEMFGKSKTALEQVELQLLKVRFAEADAFDSTLPQYLAALDARIKAQERYVQALQKSEFVQANSRLDEAGRIAEEETYTLQLELSLIGQTQQAREQILGQRRAEIALAKELNQIEKLNLGEGPEAEAQRAELRAKARANAVVEANNAASKAVLDEWQRTTDSINNSLTDALLRGFESGKGFAENFRDTLKNMFSTLVLRPVISAALSPLAGIVSSVVGNTGGGGLLGMLSNGSSLYNGYSNVSGFLNSPTGASLANYFGMGNGGSFASTVGKGFATDAMGATVSPGASGATLNAGGFSAASLGMVAAIAVLAKSATEVINATKGEKRFGAGYSFDPKTGTVTQTSAPTGGDAQADAVKAMIGATATGISDALRALGGTATLTGFQAAYESSNSGRGGVFAGGTLSNGVMFGESGQGSNYDWTGPLDSKFEQWSNDLIAGLRNNDLDGSPEDLAVDLQQSFVSAIQASFGLLPKIVEEKFFGESPFIGSSQGDTGIRESVEMSRWVRVYDEEMKASIKELGLMPKRLMELILDVDPEALSAEATAELAGKLSTLFANVNGFREIVEGLPVAELRDATFDIAAGLVEFSGGLEPLAANIRSYSDNFYSAEEKRAQAVKNITKVLNEAGLAVTEAQVGGANRVQFRAVAEQFAAMGEDGLKVYSALLSVSGAFAGITEAADSATTSVEILGESLIEQFAGFADRLLSPSQLRQFNVQRVQAELAGKGFNVSEEAINGLTKQSLGDLFLSLDRTTEAGLKAAEALSGVAPELLNIIDAADQLRLDALSRQFGDVASVIEAMATPAETLADKWHRTRNEMLEMSGALDELLGVADKTPLEKLSASIAQRDGLVSGIASLDDTIEGLRIRAATPEDRIGLSQTRVDRLTAEFTATPTGEALAKLQAAILEHVDIVANAEIEASKEVTAARLDGLETELEGVQRLANLAKELPRFLTSLTTGQLSPLSPKAQLAGLKTQFESDLEGVRRGDPDAIENLIGSATAYLDKGQTLFGRATTPYSEIFGAVYGGLNGVGLDPTALQARAKTVEGEIKTLTQTTIDTSADQLLALESLRTLADGKLTDVNSEIVAGTTIVRDAISALSTSVDDLGTQIKAIVQANATLYGDVLTRFPEVFNGGTGSGSTSQALTLGQDDSTMSLLNSPPPTLPPIWSEEAVPLLRDISQKLDRLDVVTVNQQEQIEQMSAIYAGLADPLQTMATTAGQALREGRNRPPAA